MTGDAYRWYKKWKKSLVCTNCKASHEAIIEFHHDNPKTKLFSVAKFAYKMIDWRDVKRVRRELEKCIPLCKNCHAKRHWEIKQVEKGRTYVE